MVRHIKANAHLLVSGFACALVAHDEVCRVHLKDVVAIGRAVALIAQIGIPWYNVPGNHELNFEANSDEYSLETFKKFFGPPYYAFEYADALFVVLDNIDYQGNGEADPGDVRGNGGYEARISKRQLRWLEKELEYVDKDRLVFVATHAPLGSEVTSSATDNRRGLFQLLSGRPNLYSVAGHTHTNNHLYFGEEDGFDGPGEFHHHVLATVSGSWMSQFHSHCLLCSNWHLHKVRLQTHPRR